MSLYRLSVSVVSRGKTGEPTTRSAVAAASYLAREPIYDERQREWRDYTADRHDLVRSEILLPDGAPVRFLDRATLWNEVEARETRINSQVARAVLVTLPRGVALNDNVELVRDFAARAFVSRGMVADFAVHAKEASDGQPQPHAHVLLTMRRITEGVFGEKAREWNTRAMIEGWRATWAEMANRALEVVGSHVRLDHRALARRVVQVVVRAVEVTTQAMREAACRVPVPELPRQVAALRNDRWLREVLPAGVAKVREVAVGRTPRSKPMLKTAEPPEQMVEPDERRVERVEAIEALRERLRPAIRSAAVGVAAAGWSYRGALDGLIADHLYSTLQQFPELEPQFDSMEAGIGNALANAVQRLQGEIQRDGEALGKRYQREGTVMSEAQREATQDMREIARQNVPERVETAERQDELASRRAQQAQSRSYVLTR